MTETELEAQNFPDAPKMVSATFPGSKTLVAPEQSARTESMARGGGGMPIAMGLAFGATFRDPDGNTYVDLSAGVGVGSVGRCHPKVVEAIRRQSETLMHSSKPSGFLTSTGTGSGGRSHPRASGDPIGTAQRAGRVSGTGLRVTLAQPLRIPVVRHRR